LRDTPARIRGLAVFAYAWLASETVILELVRSKCMPTLLYGLESCQLSNADLRLLDFTYL